jgi:hypothetical protein
MPNHNDYRITPIKSAFLDRARRDGLDDQGQAVERQFAAGGEPCRDVLRGALPGEEIILASYCPFALAGPYREYGPVFILAEASAAPVDCFSLPTGAAAAYFGATFVLRAYSKDERIVDAALSSPQQAEQQLRQFFLRDEINFVLARFAAYGCYGCRVERFS